MNNHGEVTLSTSRVATRRGWINVRTLPKHLTKPLLAVLGVVGVNSIGLQMATGTVDQSTLILLLFLEGGAGLLAGTGIALSGTPSISKAGETLFGTSPWSRESERHAERVGLQWMIASAIIVLLGIALSAG